MEYSQIELVRGIRNKDSAAYEYMIGKYTKIERLRDEYGYTGGYSKVASGRGRISS